MKATAVTPFITDWSALTPFGVGRQAFVDGFSSDRSGGFLVDDFDPVALLGAKGTRSLDRMTLMSIATCGMLLAGHPDLDAGRRSLGLVLGTSTGSVASIVDFTRDTFVRDKPYHVNPAAFPNTVMNGAAGHTAIWHGLRGLNTTVSAGQVTALAALRYASRIIRRGYADVIVVGAIEEMSVPVTLAAQRLRAAGLSGGMPGGEGCLMFLLDGRADGQQTEHRMLAEVVDFTFAVSRPDSAAGRADLLASAVTALLGRNDVSPAEVRRVSLSQAGDAANDDAERAAVDRVFGTAGGPERIVISRNVGNSFSALGAFQLAGLLAAAEAGHDAPRCPAVITSLGCDGSVACALIRT